MLGRGKLASVALAALLLASALAQAQRPDSRARPPQPYERQQDAPGHDRAGRNRPGQAGDWLRRYKDLPPDEQRRALENDPQFRRLPPPRQAQMLRQLRIFSSLPPQKQDRILRRMEVWEHLTPDQRRQAREVGRQLHQLPPDRRQAVKEAIRRMGDLTPAQRDQLIDSDQFRSQFSPQERGLLHGAARLPLAPRDRPRAEPPEE